MFLSIAEINLILCNPKDYYRVSSNPQLFSVLNQINPFAIAHPIPLR
jgi:hypothetical protein